MIGTGHSVLSFQRMKQDTARLKSAGPTIASLVRCPAKPQHRVKVARTPSPVPNRMTTCSVQNKRHRRSVRTQIASPCTAARASITVAHENSGSRCDKYLIPDCGAVCAGSDGASLSPRTSSAIIDQSAVRGRSGSSIELLKKNHRKPLIQTAAIKASTGDVSAFRSVVGSMLDGL